MKLFKKTYFLIFPLLIVIVQLVSFKLLQFQIDTLTILITIGIAYLLSPRVKNFENQQGKQTQIVWLFLKKSIKI